MARLPLANPTAPIAAAIILAALLVAVPCAAKGTPGTVVSIDGDKVTVQVEKGKAAGFPVGMRDVEVRQSATVCVRGRVMAVRGDRITLKIIRGRPSSLSVGAAVEVGQAADAGAEGIDGC